MIFLNTFKAAIQYAIEGFLEIFSPHVDRYPAIGVQPYGGTITRSSRFNW